MGEVNMDGFDLGWLLGMSKNPVGLGLLIFGLVQTVKRQAEARRPPIVWNPWLWRGIAAAFGLLCAALLHLWTGNAMLGARGWTGVLIFGLVAAVVSVAGRDGLKTVLEWVGNSGQATQTTTLDTTTAPVGTVAPGVLQDGPPPQAFEQASVRPLASLASLPESDVDGRLLTHPAFALRE